MWFPGCPLDATFPEVLNDLGDLVQIGRSQLVVVQADEDQLRISPTLPDDGCVELSPQKFLEFCGLFFKQPAVALELELQQRLVDPKQPSNGAGQWSTISRYECETVIFGYRRQLVSLKVVPWFELPWQHVPLRQLLL